MVLDEQHVATGSGAKALICLDGNLIYQLPFEKGQRFVGRARRSERLLPGYGVWPPSNS